MSENTHDLDFKKELFSYYKHLTALSTGSIILIATFLEKLFTKPEWRYAVVISLLAFTVCVIASTITYTVVLFFEHPFVKKDNTPEWAHLLGGLGMLGAWGFFLIGVVSLAAFSIRNFIA